MNTPDTTDRAAAATAAVPRAIEVGFPIVEINRLAEPERNSFKPIYQMHEWFLRAPMNWSASAVSCRWYSSGH